MKKVFSILFVATLAFAMACQPEEDPKTGIEAKKAELDSLRTLYVNTNRQIKALEKELTELDPDFARNNRPATRVTTVPVTQGDFEHFIEVTGSVQSRKNITVGTTTGGEVISVRVQEGQRVQKNALLIELDVNLLQKSLAEVMKALELADTVFVKQKALWEQNVGSELQYLQAKNNKETLEARIATLNAQIAQGRILAPFSGTIDAVNINVGEMAAPGMPLIQMVGSQEMYVDTEVSESYIGAFEKNDPVEVFFPNLGKSLQSKVEAVGQVINQKNRTFTLEIEFPRNAGFVVKPNLISVVKIRDYAQADALSVPTNLIQRDKRGPFVYVLAQSENGQAMAKKMHVEKGVAYGGMTLVTEGLTGNEQLIDKGFREVADGMNVKEVAEEGNESLSSL